MRHIVQESLKQVLKSLSHEGVFSVLEIPHIEVSFPKDESHGDYTSNIAMALSRMTGKSPMDIAKLLKEKLQSDEAMKPFHIEMVVPGYLNFSYTEKSLVGIVENILEKKETFGNSDQGSGVRVNNEFISANPTGPLHLGNARGGFLGDALSRILKKVGYDVSTEYYVNDAGEQVMKLGHSVLKDDEAVYEGAYIDTLNFQLPTSNRQQSTNNSQLTTDNEQLTTDNSQLTTGNKQQTTGNLQLQTVWEVGEWASGVVMEEYIKKTISEKMNISFDVFVSERKDIIEAGYVDRAIGILKEKKLTFETDGALWLKTTAFGDDKDRVLIKENGEKTYFASDCGYLLFKKERNFERLIEIWGADHHGYVTRFRAVAEALGFEKDHVKFILVQLVRLMKDGQEFRMSKRAGNVVTIDDLVDCVGADVARFFFLLYSPDTHMNFDLGLAEERSQKNPVFYVQYAHARMASILRKAEEESGIRNQELGIRQGEISLKNQKEILLVRHLAKFPEMVEGAAEALTAHQLPQYAIRLADVFHSFYDECTVIDPNNEEGTRSRLALVRATKIVLVETLRLMGVSAPERM